MAVERRDPLPPGRYSFFVLVSDGPAWAKWLGEQGGRVRVVAQVDKRALGTSVPVFATRWDGTIIQDLVGTDVLFDVLEPTPWVGFGFPSIESAPPTGPVPSEPRSVDSWVKEKRDNPEYQPDPSATDELARLIKLGGLFLLGAVVLDRALNGPRRALSEKGPS